MMIWTHDVSVLFENKLEFWPRIHQDPVSRTNAAMRFILYFSILVSLYRKTILPILVVILGMLVIYIHTQPSEEEKTFQVYNLDACSVPTESNPFVNRLLGDSVDKKPVCDYDTISYDMDNQFVKNLPRNVWDIYNKNNSQRQFYTVPNNNLPNDQTKFANWLYGTDKTCKTHPEACNGSHGLS